MARKNNWARSLKDYIDKHPLTILVVLAVFFISSFITISEGFSGVFNYYQSVVNWREVEYKKVNSVQAGMSLDKFNEVFGIPLYTRASSNGYKEYIYKKRDYWIQAISSSSGAVAFYSITSCDKNFTPSIESNPINAKIKLRESTFESVSESIQSKPNISRYYFRQATANSYFYDSYSFGNPSAYKTVFVGINDACNMPEASLPEDKVEYSEEDLDNPAVKEFRKTSRIDSYGESSPFYDGSEVLKDFQFGVDRIQIRTLRD